MNIEYNDFSNDETLRTFEKSLSVKAEGNQLQLQEKQGDGYVYTKTFSSGVSMLLSDLELKETLYTVRHCHQGNQIFMLSFNKKIIVKDKVEAKVREDDNIVNINNSIVRLCNSLTSVYTVLPANVRILNATLFFSKELLYRFFEHDVVENFLNTYYTLYIKTAYTTTLDAFCHTLLNELFGDVNGHPLRSVFVETRVMLLLENFFINFITKDQHNARKLRFKLDDISRLVEAENMLLANFSEPAPTIDVLSKACAMSATKFKTDFKALYGLPVYEYYQKNRMAHARSLIRAGTNSMAEVGLKVGYSNLGHFAAAFKKEFNMLPKDWRQANKFSDSFD